MEDETKNKLNSIFDQYDKKQDETIKIKEKYS